MTENQKLREALLTALPYLEDMQTCDECKQCYKPAKLSSAIAQARQALALPTADHIPDAGKMIETATPAPKPASPSPEQATPRTPTSNRRTECESPNEQQQPCAII